MTSLPFEDLPPSKTVEDALFDQHWPIFWAGWPHKVDKQEAMSLFRKALKKTSPEEIIDGRDRYKAHKPDWQSWMSPAKFIRRQRWEDEYETPSKPKSDYETQSLETAAWKIRHGTGDGHQFPVTRKQARACIDAGLVTEEQARPWL